MYNSGVKKIISGITALFLIAATLILGDTVYNAMFKSDEPTTVQTTQQPTVPTQPTTVVQPTAPLSTQPTSTEPTTPAPSESASSTQEPSSLPQTSDEPTEGESTTQEPSQPASADVSTLDTAGIVALLGDAVNKTKSHTESLTAAHKETFDAKVVECTGGNKVAGVVNSVLSGIVKPTDEVLNYANGKAVNSEGETVEILLPKAGPFSLTVDGVESASAVKEGDNTIVDIKLKPEKSSLGQVPTYAASCVGYLDVSTISAPGVSINSAETSYSGITIHAIIRPDGNVQSATYVTPVHLELGAKAAFINASAVIDATETESFEINW